MNAQHQRDRTPCLVPGCKNPSTTRGLCNTCYQYAVVLVRKGVTTWDKLVKTGKALPPKNTGGMLTSWRAKFFTESGRSATLGTLEKK